MILNLDKYFNPFPSSKKIEFEFFTFSGGEPHIHIISNLDEVEKVIITHRITSFNAVGAVMLAVDALKHLEVQHIELFMPYFPGARQDRLMQKGEAFTAKVYADLFNSLSLDKLTIFDVHSDVTLKLLNNVVALKNHSFIERVMQDLPKDTLLISPDAGALKKIYPLAKFLGNYVVIECSKERDSKTRSLSNFKVHSADLRGKACLIVDDICDGGRTFLGLAEELKQKNAGNLYLAVSHGIFSHGFDKLNTYFDKTYTTNAFKDVINEKVVQIKMRELIF